MERQRVVAHPEADSEEDISVTEDPPKNDYGIEASHFQRSANDDSSSNNQDIADCEDDDNSIWASIGEL